MTGPRERPGRHAAEAERLAAPVPGLGLPRPAYDGRSIGNVPVTLWQAVGADRAQPEGFLPALEPTLDPFQGGRAPGTVVVFLVDGLGWYPFARWAENGCARGARWSELASPITSVFPTTTTTALTSLSSGTAPATHGLVGYRQYLPRFGAVADLLRMSPVGTEAPGLLIGPDWRPEFISGSPTIFRRGLAGVALSRWQFAGTGFTRLLYDGAEYSAYSTATDLAEGLRLLLTRADPPPVVFAYWDELDSIQHVRGPNDDLFGLEVERLVQLLEFVSRHVPASVRRSTTLLVTGDHGQVAATPAARLAVESHPRLLAEMARPLAGDRRAGLFAAPAGRVEALREALEGVVPPGSTILPIDRAISMGLFGPPPYHPELRERLGDLLVLVPSPAGLTQQLPGRRPPDRFLFGAHGGLDPAELLVPLVAGPLESLAPAEDPPAFRRKR